ncbi:MAG TPA: hypothetical protein VKP69_17635 [Isosphaeraceae bacterium]|nr:hypothetical protein [Isosphaeraceae bacterium]
MKNSLPLVVTVAFSVVGVAAFGQPLNASEVAGLAMAIGSLVLLMRFA